LKKIYHTAIVGGGAAGLISAVDLLRGKNAISGSEIIILERNDRVGKKLIATGNGQGNLTNSNIAEENYYGDKEFIKEFLSNYKEIDLNNYLEDVGIPLTKGKDGKIYPLSKQANSVLDTIRAYLNFNGVKEQTLTTVTAIKKDSGAIKLTTNNGEFFAKNVIYAVGGAAAKQFGTDGTSYSPLEKLGHKKTAIYPSLVQLKTETNLIKGLKGLKEVAKVTAIYKGKEIKSAVGDLLFTEFGVSGSAVFAVSAAVVGLENVTLNVEFLHDIKIEDLEEILIKRQKLDYINREDLLNGVLNKRIGQAVIKSAADKSPKGLAHAAKNFKLKVVGNLGFNYAQVTKGGIVTDDINSKTMESKLMKNLYVVGEILNVDGDCGGYNLTFAFVTGLVAARSVKGEN
jgi:predicted Rossmann fold flavoprotein